MRVFLPACTAALLAAVLPAAAVPAGTNTLAERLCAGYGALTNVSCSIRKDTVSGRRTLRMLSRVYYQAPDRIHVENVLPSKRRIVCDGTTLYYRDEALPKGFSKPVGDLDPDWLIMLRSVPGSPMEHLLRLKGLPEQVLPPASDAPVRRGYEAKAAFVVLSCDASNRLARVEFFTGPDQQQRTAVYDYSAFEPVGPGCWIPLLHKVVLNAQGTTVEETRRIDSLSVNEPLPPGLFVHDAFFKGVEFTDEFDDMAR